MTHKFTKSPAATKLHTRQIMTQPQTELGINCNPWLICTADFSFMITMARAKGADRGIPPLRLKILG